MLNIPFIFKILYPDVAGRKLIYSGGAKEMDRHLASWGGLEGLKHCQIDRCLSKITINNLDDCDCNCGSKLTRFKKFHSEKLKAVQHKKSHTRN